MSSDDRCAPLKECGFFRMDRRDAHGVAFAKSTPFREIRMRRQGARGDGAGGRLVRAVGAAHADDPGDTLGIAIPQSVLLRAGVATE
jgi:hypothetical protein